MKLLVVSDIYNQPSCRDCLSRGLLPEQQVIRWRLADLCGAANLSGEALHAHLFGGGGIATAVQRLQMVEGGDLIGLGYSAGGTALWRAAVSGLRLKHLICLSSTRLRLETCGPELPTAVFFGERDSSRPPAAWGKGLCQSVTVFPGCGHDFYRQPETPPAQAVRKALARALT